MIPTEAASFLDSRVRKYALPVFQLPVPAGAPVAKRLMLPQGELAQFYDDDQPIRFIASIELREECTRGNHFHRVKEEFIYILAGEALLVVEDTQTQARASIPLVGGDLVFISTGIAHAMKTVRSGYGVEYSSARYDSADTHRYALI